MSLAQSRTSSLVIKLKSAQPHHRGHLPERRHPFLAAGKELKLNVKAMIGCGGGTDKDATRSGNDINCL
jgi:hypothetical protein